MVKGLLIRVGGRPVRENTCIKTKSLYTIQISATYLIFMQYSRLQRRYYNKMYMYTLANLGCHMMCKYSYAVSPSERFCCPSMSSWSRPAVSRIFSCCKRRLVSTSGTFFLVTCKIPMLGNLRERERKKEREMGRERERGIVRVRG